ncbi:MAG: YgaP family membrane protein [Pontibacterium sp.]
MTINAALRLMAGTVILVSLALGTYVSEYWYYLTGFVGLNLLQSAFSGWCPAVAIFKMMGLKAEACNVGGMTVNQGVHIIAGSIVLITVALVLFLNMNPQVLIVTAIVGLSLTQSAFTGWCPAMTISRMLGFKHTDKPE